MKNFDSLKMEILTVWKGKFWQFEMENFDSLKMEILTVWNGRSVWSILNVKKPNKEDTAMNHSLHNPGSLTLNNFSNLAQRSRSSRNTKTRVFSNRIIVLWLGIINKRGHVEP
jgi:hypothetical protein